MQQARTQWFLSLQEMKSIAKTLHNSMLRPVNAIGHAEEADD